MLNRTKQDLLTDRLVARTLGRGEARRMISWLIRNRRMFLRQPTEGAYLDVGCGPNLRADYCDLDYDWRPGMDMCWDVRRGLPLPDAWIAGLYSEHCIEHIELAAFSRLAAEFHRVLKPGAYLRIVVPDGGLYLGNYVKGAAMPYADRDQQAHGFYSPIMSVNRIFREHGHLFIYDFATLRHMLERVGFQDVRQCAFGVGADPRLLIDSPQRAVESLYVEARK